MKGTTNNMNLNRSLYAGVFAVLAMGYGAGKANAQFATFSGADLVYTGGTLTGSGTTSFTFGEGALAGDTVSATFALSTTASGTPTVLTGPPLVIEQSLGALSASFTATTPVDGQTDLVTIAASSGILEYDSVTSTATVDFGSLTLTSGLYGFTGPNDFTFNFVPVSAPTVSASVLQDFSGTSGSGVGTITSAVTGVPEPGMISMLVGLAVTGSGLALRRRRAA